MKSIRNFLGLFTGVLALVGVVSSGGESDVRKDSEKFIKDTLNLTPAILSSEGFDITGHNRRLDILNEYFEGIGIFETEINEEKIEIKFLSTVHPVTAHNVTGCSTEIKIVSRHDTKSYPESNVPIIKEAIQFYNQNGESAWLSGGEITPISDALINLQEAAAFCDFESRTNEIFIDLANIES